MYIVEIEEICIRYGRTYGRYIDIYTHTYKRKISIGITCVGLASARPNKRTCLLSAYFLISACFLPVIKHNLSNKRMGPIKTTVAKIHRSIKSVP